MSLLQLSSLFVAVLLSGCAARHFRACEVTVEGRAACTTALSRNEAFVAAHVLAQTPGAAASVWIEDLSKPASPLPKPPDPGPPERKIQEEI